MIRSESISWSVSLLQTFHYLSWPATVELSLPRRLLPNIDPNRFSPIGNRLDETEIDAGLSPLPIPNGFESPVWGLVNLGVKGEMTVLGL